MARMPSMARTPRMARWLADYPDPSLCTFVRFETIWSDQESGKLDISLHNFKKSLDIFSPQIERKRSKEHLVIILAVKESFERFSCLEFICEKSKYREAGLKHKLKL